MRRELSRQKDKKKHWHVYWRFCKLRASLCTKSFLLANFVDPSASGFTSRVLKKKKVFLLLFWGSPFAFSTVQRERTSSSTCMQGWGVFSVWSDGEVTVREVYSSWIPHKSNWHKASLRRLYLSSSCYLQVTSINKYWHVQACQCENTDFWGQQLCYRHKCWPTARFLFYSMNLLVQFQIWPLAQTINFFFMPLQHR